MPAVRWHLSSLLSRNVFHLLSFAMAVVAAGPAYAQVPAPVAPAVTAADIRFMQDMIGHHQQAVEMTALVASRTRRPQIRMLAERIAVSQTDELSLMRQWLKVRGGVADSAMAHRMPGTSTHVGHDMSGMPEMPGMLSRRDMVALRAARGARFDQLFLSGMIRHHEGALTMVERLLATSGAAQESSINRFVTDVDADQRAEILRMRLMQRRE